jgi:uncharacterized protein (DUF4213/DUF364 family)
LTASYKIPPVEKVFFPPFCKGGQPKDSQFMAVSLEGGATGISYVLLPDEYMEEYTALKPDDFEGKDPESYALKFSSPDPINAMIGLATINAICQQVMKETNCEVDSATDSLGLLAISPGDRVGMVGFFSGLSRTIIESGADLVVIEKNEKLIRKFPDLTITMDTKRLRTCNKIISTSTTVLNDSLDEILEQCSPDTFVSIVGPTAGYFPDPLFSRGVDVVGGRVVKNGKSFMRLLKERRRWGDTTQRTCFQKKTYVGII